MLLPLSGRSQASAMAQESQSQRGMRGLPTYPHYQAHLGLPVHHRSVSPHQQQQQQQQQQQSQRGPSHPTDPVSHYHRPPSRSSLAIPEDPLSLRLPALLATQTDSSESSSDSGFSAHQPAQKTSSSSQKSIQSNSPGHHSAHVRSMSHPFPSFFGLRKRQDLTGLTAAKEDRGSATTTTTAAATAAAAAGAATAVAGGGAVDVDSTDDEAGPHVWQPGRHHLAMSSHSVKRGSERAAGTPTSAKDFFIGHCMTCGNKVRLPRSLDVFKCASCLTVNDIGRHAHEGWRDGDARKSRSAGYGGSVGGSGGGSPPQYWGWGRVKPISVEHSRRLIKQCLHSFLATNLNETRTPPSPSAPQTTSPASPSSPSSGRDDPRRASGYRSRGGELASNDRTQRRVASVQLQLGGTPMVLDDGVIPRPNPLRANPHTLRSFSSSHPERPIFTDPHLAGIGRHKMSQSTGIEEEFTSRIFKPLEDYILTCFSSFDCVNSSFPSHRPVLLDRPQSRLVRRKPVPAPAAPKQEPPPRPESTVFDLDPKLLLVGDFAENGLWWTGAQPELQPTKPPLHVRDDGTSSVSFKSPQLDWTELSEWYSCVINVAEPWKRVYDELVGEGGVPNSPQHDTLQALELQLLRAQEHIRRMLLRATETLLKRPGRPIQSPENLRFLLIVLDNPLIRRDCQYFQGLLQPRSDGPDQAAEMRNRDNNSGSRPLGSQISGIIKRVLGLISNASNDCQSHLISWFARGSAPRFVQTKELVSGFLTYRLIRQNEAMKKGEPKAEFDITAGLIPSMSTGRSPASLHAALGTVRTREKPTDRPSQVVYYGDWQIKAASCVLSLLFAANNSLEHARRGDASSPAAVSSDGTPTREVASTNGQLLPTSDFYNSMLDFTDLVADFGAWESKRGRFSFCQYPFLLSIWAKTRILEFDARRQMESKARDAFFDSIMNRKSINQFLVLDVRRECLVEDSLKAVSEVIGSGSEDIKKGLRIVFKGEEGVDAGGLRKEWFLLLVREVFNPDHGMFVYDEDSQYCYFNPNSFETSDQFFLVGVVMGLAIYNSTILDVALPSFAFRKLLASAPALGANAAAHPRPLMTYTLDDLSEFRPRLAKGLRQLLEYDGNVEDSFCVDFCVDVEKYGTVVKVPLCPGGESKPVTNANRREYVDLYVRYLLDGAVIRQFEPFKRGFFTICGGNALSLFRPDEIELLICGSDEELDINALRGVAEYANWDSPRPDGSEPVVEWFWDSFADAPARDQRKLLSFITGSDRIPATGASMLSVKISCLGDDCDRYPIARTCFNTLSLWRYSSREKLELRLWRAVHESEGFGLK